MRGVLPRRLCARWHLLPTCHPTAPVSIGTAICCCTCDAEFISHDCCIVLRGASLCTCGARNAAVGARSAGRRGSATAAAKNPCMAAVRPAAHAAACISLICNLQAFQPPLPGAQSQHGSRRAWSDLWVPLFLANRRPLPHPVSTMQSRHRPWAAALGLLALGALLAGAAAQAPEDLVTVLPDLDDDQWRNLTFFAGEYAARHVLLANWRRKQPRCAAAATCQRASIPVQMPHSSPAVATELGRAVAASAARPLGAQPSTVHALLLSANVICPHAPLQGTLTRSSSRCTTTTLKPRCLTRRKRRCWCGSRGEFAPMLCCRGRHV